MIRWVKGVNKSDLDKWKLYTLIKVLCALGFLIWINKGLVVFNGLEEAKKTLEEIVSNKRLRLDTTQ